MEQKSSTLRMLYVNVREIVVILLIVFAIRTFVFGLYQVPTGSMEITMLKGERFFADKLTPYFRAPQRGEVIAINSPMFAYSENKLVRLYQEYADIFTGPDNWTKRVIGVPGDYIHGVVEDGKPVIYINDKKMDESAYLNKYPLIAQWRPGIEKPFRWDMFTHWAQQIADQLAQKGELIGATPELATERIMEDAWAPVSYDPSASLDNQPFYRLNRTKLVYAPVGTVMQTAKVTPEGLVLKESGTPVPPVKRIPLENDDYLTNGDEFSVHLKADEYWLMGDNRRGSHDSRFFGPVKRRLIHGRILFRIWSMDTDDSWLILDLIKHPIDFWRKVRWDRVLQRVR